MTRKKSLHVLGKSLMPEILPDPTAAATSTTPARERVRARLRQITERAAALAAAASLSAGCSGKSHGLDGDNVAGDGGTGAGRGGRSGSGGTGGYLPTGGTSGYGVVDPLPPPSGGYGGMAGYSAGSGGYAVVDPVPPPYICPAPDALAVAVNAEWRSFSIELLVQPAVSPTLGPITLQSARATGGVSASVDPGSQTVRLSVPSGSWPGLVELSLSLTCSGQNGFISYEVGLRLDTSRPAASGIVFYQFIDGDRDAGI